MEITEVRVFPVSHRDERLLAFATIIFDNCFVVRDLRIIRGNGGLFVAMPSRKRSDGTYSDVAHPLHADLRQRIEEQVIAAFQEEMAKPSAEGKPEVLAAGPANVEQLHKVAV